MGVTIVSGWDKRKYDKLGEQFLNTANRYWPADGVSIFVYRDDDTPSIICSGPVPIRDAYAHGYCLKECEGLAEFQSRHKDNKDANGLGAPNKHWKPVDLQKGYCWRFDAVKFSTQLFIPEAASKHLPDGEIMVWFDIDVVFTAPIPKHFVEGLIGDADCVYLGRPPKHSELGFWAVRLNYDTRCFLKSLAAMYRTDAIFALHEWHSAYVFDRAREAAKLKEKNLTPNGHGHVWPGSRLGQYSRHLKGKRKSEFMLEAA